MGYVVDRWRCLHGVFAVGWQLWGTVWADGLLFWVGVVGRSFRESVMGGYFEWWVLLV